MLGGVSHKKDSWRVEAKKEEIETKNLADQAIYTAEKAIRDGGDKVPADVKTDVEAKISDLKKVKDGADLAAIKKGTEDLALAMQKIGEAMTRSTDSGQVKNDDKGSEGNVRDADFKEKK